MTQIIDRTGFVPNRFADTLPVPLLEYDGAGALLLSFEDGLAEVAAHFATLSVIVVPFETSADGRGFSTASTLRSMGYRGHLRASGHILVDQFRAAMRSGFDDIEISDAQVRRNPEPQWQAVPFLPSYQHHIITWKDTP